MSLQDLILLSKNLDEYFATTVFKNLSQIDEENFKQFYIDLDNIKFDEYLKSQILKVMKKI